MGGNYDFVFVDEVLVNVRFKYFGVLKFWYIGLDVVLLFIFFYWLKYLYFVGIIVWYYIMIKCV